MTEPLLPPPPSGDADVPRAEVPRVDEARADDPAGRPGATAPLAGVRPVRWGLGDAALGFLLANVLAAVVSAVVLGALGYYDEVVTVVRDGEATKVLVPTLSLGLTALLQVPLWTGYLGVPLWAARTKGNGVVADFGLRLRWYDVPAGVGAGLATQLVLVPLLYLPFSQLIDLDSLSDPARELTSRATDPVGVVLLVLIVAVGAPIVEELFFRGLLLRSIENRWGTVAAVVISSVIFGAIHLQLLQLPALAMFGVVAALLTVKTGRLGPAIAAHVAFNGVATALLLLGG